MGSHLVSSFIEMKLALSLERESQRTFLGGNTRQRPMPACRRGTSSGSDSVTGASGAPRRYKPVGLSRGYHKDTFEAAKRAVGVSD